MDPEHVTAGVALAGAVAIVAALLAPAQIAFLPGVELLAMAIGVTYLACAGVGWLLLRRDRPSFALAVAPALLAPVVTVLAFSGGDPGRLVGGVGLVTLSGAALLFGLVLAFPLGVASRTRQGWAVVLALALAAVPMIGTAAGVLPPGPPEDSDLVVLVGMLAVVGALPAAIPLYVLGRRVRRAVADGSPSPYPPLAAAAIPLVLLLAGALAAPFFVRGTPYGPLFVLVPAVGLLGLAVQIHRLRD